MEKNIETKKLTVAEIQAGVKEITVKKITEIFGDDVKQVDTYKYIYPVIFLGKEYYTEISIVAKKEDYSLEENVEKFKQVKLERAKKEAEKKAKKKK